MAADNYQFMQTYKLFREHLSGYPNTITYEDWLAASDEDQVALLYVTFYKSIVFAWYSAITSCNIPYVPQEDGVSTVLIYLTKNVEKIKVDRSRFCPTYIGKVAYNCIGCLRNNRIGAKYRAEVEESNERFDGEHHYDLWTIIADPRDDIETQQIVQQIWDVIESLGPKHEKVVNHLINPTDELTAISPRKKIHKIDRLADVEVTEAEYLVIVEELKVKLEPYFTMLFS